MNAKHYTSCGPIKAFRIDEQFTACGLDETHIKTKMRKKVTCKSCKNTNAYKKGFSNE